MHWITTVFPVLMISIHLPDIYAGHDLVLLKGKAVFVCWHMGGWGFLEDGEIPRVVLFAVQKGSCCNHQTEEHSCRSTSLWDEPLAFERLLAKLFTPENKLILHIMVLFFIVSPLLNSKWYEEEKKESMLVFCSHWMWILKVLLDRFGFFVLMRFGGFCQ